ncbi:hypothetical protein ACI79G_19070 [Geodermatophilus sp. SYSU D00779]
MTGQVWVVRAGEQARYVEEFEHGRYIAIGFRELAEDDLADVGPEALRARASNPTQHNFASQLINFAFRIEIGDLVVVPRLPKRRDYLVGRVTGPYRHVHPDRPSGVHQRPVEWLGTFQREALSQEAINTLGAILTVFRPSRAEAELRSLITALTSPDATGRAMSQPAPSATSSDPVGSRSPDGLDGGQRRDGSMPVIQFDVRLDGHGRAEVVCNHPALVMEQVPRHLDPSGSWRGVPGIYVLTGTDLEVASTRTGLERTLTTTSIVRPWAYVGLSEDFLGRLGSHRQNKPEWRRALLVRSGGTPFSSDDIKYLEREVHAVLADTDEVRMDQATPRGNLSARPKNLGLLDACAHAVVSVLRLTGTLI